MSASTSKPIFSHWCRRAHERQSSIYRYLTRYPNGAALIYVAFVIALALMALVAILDIGGRHRAVNASAQVLARLERQTPALSSRSNWASDAIPPGSPFLEGQTVTVASAALLQQITAAITGAEAGSYLPRSSRRVSGRGCLHPRRCQLRALKAALPHFALWHRGGNAVLVY